MHPTMCAARVLRQTRRSGTTIFYRLDSEDLAGFWLADPIVGLVITVSILA